MTNEITIAQPRIMSHTEVDAVKALAYLAAQSGLSKATNPADAFFLAMYGLELGIPPMTALRTLYSIGKTGTPTCSGEAMLALMRRSGRVIVQVPDPGKIKNSATVVIERRDTGEKSEFTFTLDMAKQAGLLANPGWQKYPANMLIWRAVSMGARLMCPDIIGGLYTVEEIRPDLVFDDTGTPLSIPGENTQIDTEPPATNGNGVTITDVPAWYDDAENIGTVMTFLRRRFNLTVKEAIEAVGEFSKYESGQSFLRAVQATQDTLTDAGNPDDEAYQTPDDDEAQDSDLAWLDTAYDKNRLYRHIDFLYTNVFHRNNSIDKLEELDVLNAAMDLGHAVHVVIMYRAASDLGIDEEDALKALQTQVKDMFVETIADWLISGRNLEEAWQVLKDSAPQKAAPAKKSAPRKKEAVSK